MKSNKGTNNATAQASNAAKISSTPKLSKAQLAEVAKRGEAQILEALRSVAVAGGADGACMMALFSLNSHGLKCGPAVRMAIQAMGAEGNANVLKTRKAYLQAVADASDAGKIVTYKGKQVPVANLLATVTAEGKIKPGSLQGIYKALNPAAAKTQLEFRDWVNEQVLQLMQREVVRGGGLWLIEKANAEYLKAEYQKAEAKAKADAKAGK